MLGSEELLDTGVPWMLLFAHPGHELRAHYLMGLVRPDVAVLTDGSGGAGGSRVAESLALLQQVGARPAPIFGSLTDRDAYEAIIAGNARPFLTDVERLVDLLVAKHVRAMVVDAAEGYNPVHDVCHWIGRAAVDKARRSGVSVALFEMEMVSHPDGGGDGLRLQLTDHAFERKLQAAAQYGSLRQEAEAAFARYGPEAFRTEFLRRMIHRAPPPSSWVPHYEQVGEERVAAGRYPLVLRYSSHVKPVIDQILACTSPD